MPDAFDEHGNPINRQDCLTVCPVAHIAEAREIALWHCKNVENQVLVTLEQMIPTALAPIGETTPTHYACPRSIFPAEITAELATLDEKRAEGRNWIRGDLVSVHDVDCLLRFCCLQCTLEEFLSVNSMGVV